jgi:FAD/FMN-containing dehydrogenase
MRRRTFCASAAAALTATALPLQRLFAATEGGADVPALGPDRKQVILKGSDIDDLRAAMRGEVLTAGQDGYESARHVWNGAFDRKPAVIARCTGAADVILSVNFARAHDLLVAVRGGGHSLSGQSVCDGGMMIDLAPMQSVHVDPLGKIARVEPGVLLGKLDHESQAFGLATPAGTVSHTGAAGLTLGGGFGRIARKFGLACDNMIGADVVTAGGKLVRVSEKENPNLLWGLRGGGGNFGIVTSFEYRLYPVDAMMYGGPLVFPLEQARDVLTFFSGYALEAPDDLYTDCFLLTTPDGHKALVFDVCYSGPVSNAERVLKPLRDIRKPIQDGLQVVPYVKLQASGDNGFPVGRSYYIKSGFIHRIEPAMIEEVVGRYQTALPTTVIAFVQHGGAISRVKPDATAFSHRDAKHSALLFTSWDDKADAEPNMHWVRGVWSKVEPMTDGFYVNEMSDDDPERRVRANYGANYDRLARLKAQYDPTNLFRLNANVKPMA